MAGLHTTLLGTGAANPGPLVVFLHGLFGQGRNWTQIGKALVGEDGAADHRVLLVDLPHHGRSPWAASFDYVAIADEVAGLLSEPATVVGHSMGGKVAMVVALRHPELVERLCVVDMSPVDYPKAREFEGFVGAMRAMDLDAIKTREDAENALAAAAPDPTVRAFLLQNLRREGAGWRWQANLDVLGRDLEKLGGWPEEQLDGAVYDGPVLWLGGENSSYVVDEYAPAMDRWFPRNRRVTVKGAGHWVHSEKPDVFVEVLKRFLAR